MSDPILSLHLRLGDPTSSTLASSAGGVMIASLTGTADGPVFCGSVESNGMTVRITTEMGSSHIIVHFVLVGKDARGNPARLYVSSDGWFEKGYEALIKMPVRFMTDNLDLENELARKPFAAHGKRIGTFVELEIRETHGGNEDEGVLGLDDIEQFEQVRFKKGEYIVKQGEPVDFVYFLSSGICEVSGLTPKGEKVAYDRRVANPRTIRCFIGGLSACRPDKPHRASFVAVSECYCYRMTASEFKAFLIEHPSVLDAFMALVMDRYAVLEDMFIFKQSHNAPGLVASVILEHMVSHDGSMLLPKGLTNSSIARFAGANRVTVVRIMQALEREGVLERSEDGAIVRDVEQLRSYANGLSTLKYKPVPKGERSS